MINLLPPKEKEGLVLEKNKKLIIVLGSVAIISLVYLVLVLASFKFYVLQEVVNQKNILDAAEKKYQISDNSPVEKSIQEYNKSLIKIESFYKEQVIMNNLLEKIVDIKRPSGIYFKTLDMEKTQNNKVKVIISGMSDTRDNLLVFKENIENTEKIESAYFEPNSWIKPENADFYLTLEINL